MVFHKPVRDFFALVHNEVVQWGYWKAIKVAVDNQFVRMFSEIRLSVVVGYPVDVAVVSLLDCLDKYWVVLLFEVHYLLRGILNVPDFPSWIHLPKVLQCPLDVWWLFVTEPSEEYCLFHLVCLSTLYLNRQTPCSSTVPSRIQTVPFPFQSSLSGKIFHPIR